MKRIFILTIALSIASVFLVKAQEVNNALSPVLAQYYDVKDALVSSDAATASKKAAVLLTTIDGIDVKTLSADDAKTFAALQSKLSFDARHIAEVQDIAHQREHFAALSLNIYTLARAAKLSGAPVYEEYCPMKKAYWLSSDKAIKNPYYGSQMLTCGEVKETIK